MRCETVVTSFQTHLADLSISINKELSLHLQNCNYCHTDCHKILLNYKHNLDLSTKSDKTHLQHFLLLSNILQVDSLNYKITLINYEPFFGRFLEEFKEGLKDFIANSKKFLLAAINEINDGYDNLYWKQGIKGAILMWLLMVRLK